MSTDLCESAAKDLPEDTIVEIVSRIPVRSLIRLGCVWKSWYALLKNPNFTTKHFNHSNNNSYFIYIPRQLGTANASISLTSSIKSFNLPFILDVPFVSIPGVLRICGSCNGLICLIIIASSMILLWKPATRVFKGLPASAVNRPVAGAMKIVLGFGLDSGTATTRFWGLYNIVVLRNKLIIWGVFT